MSNLLIVDCNDQFHQIHKQWGNRSLNFSALVKLFPECDRLIAIAKCPNERIISKFDAMLKYNGFETHYLIGAPSWQTCTALMLSKIVQYTGGPVDYDFTVVTGSPDAQYVKEIIEIEGDECRLVGFSEYDWIEGLPASILTPVPMSHVLGVDHAVAVEKQ